jgi:hypothetical protein
VTATALTIALIVLAGVPVAFVIDREMRATVLLAMSFLYGSGIVFIALVAASVLHVLWTPVSVIIATAVVSALLTAVARLLIGRPADQTQVFLELHDLHVVDALTLIALAGYFVYCMVVPPGAWDYWAIWGMKAKTFFESGGVDWQLLQRRWTPHPDYPLLVPVVYALNAVLEGDWNDRWLGAICAMWGVALVVIVRARAAREAPSRALAAVTTLVLVSLAASLEVGYAEAAFIAFAAAALLFIRDAVLTDSRTSWMHGALLLGLAANVKNEGLALLVAVAVAVVLSDVRRSARVLRLWPSVVFALPWLLFAAAHGIRNDIASGSVLARVAGRLAGLPMTARLLAQTLEYKWSWCVLAIGLLVAAPRAVLRERFLVVATVLQLMICCVAYLATPHDVRWHILTSWGRVSRQVLLPITYVVVLALSRAAATPVRSS